MTPDLVKFLVILAKAGVVLLIYLFCAVALYSVARRLVAAGQYAGILFGISIAIGPVLMSWFLTMLLLAVPGQTRLFYILVPLIPFALALIINARFLRQTIPADTANWKLFSLKSAERYLWVYVAGFVMITALGGLIVLAASVPIHGNDAIEYQIVARTVAQSLDATIYPILDVDVAEGFDAPWTHPMGYVNLLTHAYIVQGFTDTSGVSRFVAPYFAFALSVVILTFGGYRNLLAGALAAIFMLCTPIFLHLVIQVHIDPIRLATLTSAVAIIWLLAQLDSWRLALFAGLVCGCSMFVHSIGILTLPLAIPTYILIARRFGIMKHVGRIALICGIGISMLIPRYVINYDRFGSLAADSVKVWEIEALAVPHTRFVTRYMETLPDKLVNGALMGVSNTELFGWHQTAFFLMLLVLLFRVRGSFMTPIQELKAQRWRDWGDPALAALLVALGYIAMMILTVLMGSDLAVKNARYVMTMQPFMIIFAVRYFTDLVFKRPLGLPEIWLEDKAIPRIPEPEKAAS